MTPPLQTVSSDNSFLKTDGSKPSCMWEKMQKRELPPRTPQLGASDIEELETILRYPYCIKGELDFDLTLFLNKVIHHASVQGIYIVGGAVPISNPTLKNLTPELRSSIDKRTRSFRDIDFVFQMKEKNLEFVKWILCEIGNNQFPYYKIQKEYLDNYFPFPDGTKHLISFGGKIDIILNWKEEHRNYLFKHDSAYVDITPYLLEKKPPIAVCLSNWSDWLLCQCNKMLWVQEKPAEPGHFINYLVRITQGYQSFQPGIEKKLLDQETQTPDKYLKCLYLHIDKQPEALLAFLLNASEIFSKEGHSNAVILELRKNLKPCELHQEVHQAIAQALLTSDPFAIINDLKLFLLLESNQTKKGLQEGELSLQWSLSEKAVASLRINPIEMQTPSPLFFQLMHLKQPSKIRTFPLFSQENAYPNSFFKLIIAICESKLLNREHLPLIETLVSFQKPSDQLQCLNFISHYFASHTLPIEQIEKWIQSHNKTRSTLFRFTLLALIKKPLGFEWTLQNLTLFSLSQKDLEIVETTLLETLAEKNPRRAKDYWKKACKSIRLPGIGILAKHTDMTEEIEKKLKAAPSQILVDALETQDPYKSFSCLKLLKDQPRGQIYPLYMRTAKSLAKEEPEQADWLLSEILNGKLSDEERELAIALFKRLDKTDWEHDEINQLWKEQKFAHIKELAKGEKWKEAWMDLHVLLKKQPFTPEQKETVIALFKQCHEKKPDIADKIYWDYPTLLQNALPKPEKVEVIKPIRIEARHISLPKHIPKPVQKPKKRVQDQPVEPPKQDDEKLRNLLQTMKKVNESIVFFFTLVIGSVILYRTLTDDELK